MSTKKPTNAEPAPAHLVDLNHNFERIGREVEEAIDRVDSLSANRAVLQQRLAQAQASKPTETEELDDPLVAALAADPGAALPSEDVAIAAERTASHHSALRTWNKEVSLLQRAISKIDGEIAAARQHVEELQQQLAVSYDEFAIAAHTHLTDLFRERFEALYAEVLAPLAGIETMKNRHGKEMVLRNHRFATKLEIAPTFYRDGQFVTENLYPRYVTRDGRREAVDHQAHFERFRLSIGGVEQSRAIHEALAEKALPMREEKQRWFNVVIVNGGGDDGRVCRALAKIRPSLSDMEVFHMVQRPPATVKQTGKHEAEEIKRLLEEAGAVVELQPA